MEIALTDEMQAKIREVARTVVRTPFTQRTWTELLYLMASAGLAGLGIVFAGITMAAGIVLAITFFGVAFIALGLRGSRGIAGFHRSLARSLLCEDIEEPPPFLSRPGFYGWLQSALRDRTGWRSLAYIVIKVPLAIFGILFGFSVWFDALTSLIYPFQGGAQPAVFGVGRLFFHTEYFSTPNPSGAHEFAIFLTGVLLFFAAPWATRVVVLIDRGVMRALLGPDAMTARVRDLEQSRAHTVDTSAATLRRIERDLHDGTQAQLVALAMRLGMAKEKLADTEHVDLDQVRELVSDAHAGAKEAIVELRDLARGIHPPALDIGLEGALATLAARSTVPTEVTISISDRPTAAIESIAYFCVAELLANVAQHARASRATVTCTQNGKWLRLVVRDDGIGGAQQSMVGSSSSGLPGLIDRVHAVDGHLGIVSPLNGPTVVTVDLPLHA